MIDAHAFTPPSDIHQPLCLNTVRRLLDVESIIYGSKIHRSHRMMCKLIGLLPCLGCGRSHSTPVHDLMVGG
jgi:hypothetical protein